MINFSQNLTFDYLNNKSYLYTIEYFKYHQLTW
jgi:hypothetical protein